MYKILLLMVKMPNLDWLVILSKTGSSSSRTLLCSSVIIWEPDLSLSSICFVSHRDSSPDLNITRTAEQLEWMAKAGPTSPSVLKGFTHLEVVFLQLHFRHHSNSPELAELWDGTVAGLTSLRRKLSAYRIVKGDSKMGLLSSTRSHMPSPTACLHKQAKFTSSLMTFSLSQGPEDV